VIGSIRAHHSDSFALFVVSVVITETLADSSIVQSAALWRLPGM
jgi:hypothetical protein